MAAVARRMEKVGKVGLQRRALVVCVRGSASIIEVG